VPSLSRLSLCRDTKARGLPDSLTGLSSLTSLDLSDNPFEGLVADDGGAGESGLAALARLPSLRRLLLRCCQLPSVPAEVCELSRLTHLDLSRNQLVELPSEMSGLRALVELVAEGNCFPRIPKASKQSCTARGAWMAATWLLLAGQGRAVLAYSWYIANCAVASPRQAKTMQCWATGGWLAGCHSITACIWEAASHGQAVAPLQPVVCNWWTAHL
jgi:hypothetical protein